MSKVKSEMVTPSKYADARGVNYSTVMKWLQKGLLAGAKKIDLPEPPGGHVYNVPIDAPFPDVKPGPVPRAVASKSARKGRAK